jgi:hypothetical protein
MSENFDTKKFLRGFDPLDFTAWAKALSHGMRVSVLVLLLLVGYSYYKGRQHVPVTVDLDNFTIQVVDKTGAKHTLVIDNHQLSFDGKKVNTQNVKELKPYGIMLRPKALVGITSSGHPAAGVALEIAHAYHVNLDAILAIPFIGAGLSYDLDISQLHIHNSAIGLAAGADLEDQKPALMAYFTVRF